MSTPDLVAGTAALTLTVAVLALQTKRVVDKLVRLLRLIIAAINRNTEEVERASTVAKLVHNELAYMRQMSSQQQETPQAYPETPPPVGRRSKMPPPFPRSPWSEDIPAKTEDTDMSLLNQTEEEVQQAQAREEARANGIDLDDDDELPQNAVVEDA